MKVRFKQTKCLIRLGIVAGALIWVAFYAYMLKFGHLSETPYCRLMKQDRCLRLLASKRYAWKHLIQQLIHTKKPEFVNLKSRLHRPVGTHGIVLTGSDDEVVEMLTIVGMLRQLGCHLPVEVWFHGNELSKGHCQQLMDMSASSSHSSDDVLICLDILEHTPQPISSVYQAKVMAIALSNFQQVLYLDVDCVPMLNPEFLFHNPNYVKYGALFWPDKWGRHSTVKGESAKPNHVMWRIVDVQYDSDNFLHTQEMSSGILLVNKLHSWMQLELALFFNIDGGFYHQVLQGDKDIFRFAWLALGAPFEFVDRRPDSVGYVTTKATFAFGLGVQFFHTGSEIQFTPGPRHVPLVVHQYKFGKHSRGLLLDLKAHNHRWGKVLTCSQSGVFSSGSLCDERMVWIVSNYMWLVARALPLPGFVSSSELQAMSDFLVVQSRFHDPEAWYKRLFNVLELYEQSQRRRQPIAVERHDPAVTAVEPAPRSPVEQKQKQPHRRHIIFE